jgi:type 2 lantibiotic (TIGR03893 family)
MSKENIANALKNPELRRDLGLESPAGQSLEELGHDELARINGGADVQPETSPACVTVGITLSLAFCP